MLHRPEDIVLKETCGACPEQYDAFLGTLYGPQVGYLRLRHGFFTVDYPDYNGRNILTARPMGDGEFMDDEREEYLQLAKMAICMELNKTGPDPVKTLEGWRQAVAEGRTLVSYSQWKETR